MIYQAKSYIQFLRKSKNQHGVHSPFVYDFATQCLYNKSKFESYALMKHYRKDLAKNKEVISVEDFGKGSRVFASPQRKVSKIAKNAGIRKKRQKMLFRISNYFQPKKTLELGTSLGLASVALSLGNSGGAVTTVEGCPHTAQKAREQFEKFQLENIELQQTTFEDFFRSGKGSHYDLIYVDGNHDKVKTLQYFQLLLEKVHNDSLIIFDDIYWSKEMTQAWQEIVRHPSVTVSIDTFYWGIVFFRREQKKQHFILRV